MTASLTPVPAKGSRLLRKTVPVYADLSSMFETYRLAWNELVSFQRGYGIFPSEGKIQSIVKDEYLRRRSKSSKSLRFKKQGQLHSIPMALNPALAKKVLKAHKINGRNLHHARFVQSANGSYALRFTYRATHAPKKRMPSYRNLDLGIAFSNGLAHVCIQTKGGAPVVSFSTRARSTFARELLRRIGKSLRSVFVAAVPTPEAKVFARGMRMRVAVSAPSVRSIRFGHTGRKLVKCPRCDRPYLLSDLGSNCSCGCALKAGEVLAANALSLGRAHAGTNTDYGHFRRTDDLIAPPTTSTPTTKKKNLHVQAYADSRDPAGSAGSTLSLKVMHD